MAFFAKDSFELMQTPYPLVEVVSEGATADVVRGLIEKVGVESVVSCLGTREVLQDVRFRDLINKRAHLNLLKREKNLRLSVLMSQSILMALVHQRVLVEVKHEGRLKGLNPVEIDVLLCGFAHWTINKRVFCFENIVCRQARTPEEIRLAITKLKTAELLEEADNLEVHRRTGKLAKNSKNRKYLKLSRLGHKALEDYWKVYNNKYTKIIEDFWQLILEDLPEKNDFKDQNKDLSKDNL